MRPGSRALLFSTLSHILVLGGGLVASGLMHSQTPTLPIDLTQFSDGGGGGGGDQSPAEAGGLADSLPAQLAPDAPKSSEDEPQADATPLPPVLSSAAEAVPVAASPELAPGPAPNPEGAKPAPGQGGGPGLGSGLGDGQGTGKGSGSGSGQGLGTGAGRGDGLDVLRAIYLREHFAYIRDQIARHLVYPQCAVRAGWSGRVLLSFVILPDGRVEELRVQRGCGTPLLDRDAQDTVRRAAPFPRPPVSARLVIPVEYTLE